jgi:hypothetical protein
MVYEIHAALQRLLAFFKTACMQPTSSNGEPPTAIGMLRPLRYRPFTA